MSTKRSTVFYGILIGLSCLVVGMVIASRLDMAPASFAGSINVPEVNSEPLEGALDAGTFRRIAADAGPAVVSIRTEGTRETRGLRDMFPGLPEGFGEDPGDQFFQGAGSGFIVDKEGYILTNRHVIEGADKVEVYLYNMDMSLALPGLTAEVVGQDELTDSALLKLTTLPSEPLSEVKFGDSAQLAPGDWVMAIGNPFGLSNTVTVGVVSASGREQSLAAPGRYEALIQTDAAINRGNSGGPLLNIRGEVIGVNTMIVSNMNGGGNIGIGFAVPINTVRDILPSLREGKVVRGRIAVQISRLPMTAELAEDLGLPRVGGVIVSTVDEGPARDAGIQPGDVITKFNGEAVNTSNELVERVMRTRPGTTVPVELYRDRKVTTVQVTVAELDLQAEQAALAPQDAQPRDRREPIETGFGMEIEDVTPAIARQLRVPTNRGGAVVSRLDPRGAAAQQGLARGDVILSVNGQDTTTIDEVADALDAVPTGRTARIIVWRQGREILVLVAKR